MATLLDREVHKEERKVHLDRIKIATYYMAVPLVLSFSVVDYFFRPELVVEFFKLRLLIIPAALLIALLFRSQRLLQKYYFIPSLALSAFLGLYSAYLTWRTGGDSSPYYAGLNLVAIGALSFLPWPPRVLPIIALIVYGPYYLSLLWDQHILMANLIPHTAFMVSTIFLSAITHYLTSRLRRQEVHYRMQLQTEIETKDQVIEDKTRHGIFLEKLTLQFSPQIIDAIKGGVLNLNDRLRQPITCIFIDIESSTSRSNRLDYLDYSNLISEFFSSCIDILLQHDVTVGTYLGDGLMAFANAPLQRPDYQTEALLACLNILKMHARKRQYFSERWRTDFNIRIGINTGPALVGFFPNDKRGTYTAIGDVVNLASRLCTRAPRNSICATKVFLHDTADKLKDLTIELCGTTESIKGFEGDRFELFAIRTLPTAAEINQPHECPLCGANLFIAEHLGELDIIRCSSCQYHDFIEVKKTDNKTYNSALI
ncbi:MAG: adenylate/guanylate cyclase domain-containing protein [Bdellovibrionales bacterium]|nr:adenylate/guanylate cyclase domain-containing protein [Bdellovibrionales bacterium]